jgi:APA family basic amino acid/polyamine antiporter
VAAFFSFAGWWDVSKMTGELRDPGRTVSRVLLFGVLIVTAVYVAVSGVFLYLVPPDEVTTAQAFAAQVGEVLFGRAGDVVFAGVVIVAVSGSLAGVMLGAPRVYHAMARDGLFHRGVAAVHPRFGTPARAVAVQAGVACLLAASGTFVQILGYFFFPAVAFVALTVSAVYVRRRLPSSGYHTPGYPVTPLLFLIPVAVLLVLLAASDPLRASIGVGVVLLGVPVYRLLFRLSVLLYTMMRVGRRR